MRFIAVSGRETVTSKVENYLGFCIRARKIIFGAETIEKQKRGVFLLIVDGGIGKNSLKPTLAAKERLACPMLVTAEGQLGEMLHKPAVKAVAITDNHLASAILSVAESDSQFKLYSGGNN